MSDFMIRFLICNLLIGGIIGMILAAERLLKNILSGRMQYNLWLVLLALLTVPFLPIRPVSLLQVFAWIANLSHSDFTNPGAARHAAAGPDLSGTADWMNDFALSVGSKTPATVGLVLCAIWMAGMLVMTVPVIKSSVRLHTLKKSALPLQNPEIRVLYAGCLAEMGITRHIPVYSTAFLKSPVIAGFLKPGIYLPIHLISDFPPSDIRYIFLHELQHYRHKDALVNYAMNLAGILYWFNPAVWFALKEMRSDREIACDTSVLKMLKEEDYEAYGDTLIRFAERLSLTPFPFAAGLGGNMRQMERRIRNIASYEKPTFQKQLRGAAVFSVITLLLFGTAPVFSTYAAEDDHYQWMPSDRKLSLVDLSAYFEGRDGSFVLYDLNEDRWSVYNMEYAVTRTSPDSTYKIYDSLFALEEGIITPDNSFLAWDKEEYPFDAWNADQTLPSAMASSVNWYFQRLDEQLGKFHLGSYIQKIGYGNEDISGDLSSYWMESSLKISPVEQVALLTSLYKNRFGFAPENIQAVEESICLSSSANGSLYGKTGTGRIDGQNVNGWFVGYVEASDNVCFFAANIRGEDAAGSCAADITSSILSDLHIWD